MIGLGWLAYVRTEYRDSTNNESHWNGRWISQRGVSLCLVDYVNAGPIWNNDDAKVKCPVAATAARGIWNGQWKTTVPGVMSVCGVK